MRATPRDEHDAGHVVSQGRPGWFTLLRGFLATWT